ncbi:MAG: hypothetical protein MK324_17645, partial [Pirellulales bacterium]|nr:hypothetical protein [Pirellulales bacterium]
MADVKKFIFWILSGLVTVTVTVMWFLAIGKLDEERVQQTNQLNSQFSAMDGIKTVNGNNHPNQQFKKGMEEIMTQVQADIYKTWDAKYLNQKTAFNWPTAEGELDQSTANTFVPLTPIEMKVVATGVKVNANDETGVEVNRIARTNYKDFLENYMPALASQVDAAWGESQVKDDGFGGGAGGAFGGDPAGGDGTAVAVEETASRMVIWESNNQKALDARFTFTEPPTTLEILYTQEDLWVLQQWLAIIKDLNKEAETAYNAKITEIIGIDLAKNGDTPGPSGVDLAKDAILNGGKVVAGGMGGMGGMGGESGGMGGMSDMMSQMAGTNSPEDNGASNNKGGKDEKGNLVATDDPGDLRYVDAQYQPLQVVELRNALSTDPQKAKKAKPELAISKRYPTRSRLKLDLRYLSQFLAACGNAELSIEVLQVRIGGESGINKGGGGSGGAMGGMDGAMGGTDG